VRRPAGPPWRLLHVASLNRVKDQGTLLRALRLVIDAGRLTPSLGLVNLDLVGEDTLGGRVQQLAADLGLSGAVRFHGFRPVDEIIPLYHQAHLYVQSSLHESQGVALCEAAAAGVPTVSTAVGLAAELAPDAAWVVPPGNAPALAEGIITLLTDRERRERLGRTAQIWAETHDADWTARAFEEIYASLSHKSPR
jgi:glycosyltransferase involved in cell wall biosynthesis